MCFLGSFLICSKRLSEICVVRGKKIQRILLARGYANGLCRCTLCQRLGCLRRGKGMRGRHKWSESNGYGCESRGSFAGRREREPWQIILCPGIYRPPRASYTQITCNNYSLFSSHLPTLSLNAFFYASHHYYDILWFFNIPSLSVLHMNRVQILLPGQVSAN